MDRRRTESMTSGAPPIKKVVGFHVEGVAPSPAPHSSILGDISDAGNLISGSPNPVIIPPTFQVCSTCRKAFLSSLNECSSVCVCKSRSIVL
jgi:hypothetical protein